MVSIFQLKNKYSKILSQVREKKTWSDQDIILPMSVEHTMNNVCKKMNVFRGKRDYKVPLTFGKRQLNCGCIMRKD